jgi:hypothetical protein
MDSLKRRRKIEAMLSDWFQSQGFSTGEGFADMFVEGEDEGPFGGSEVSINIGNLAEHIEREIEEVLK